MFLFAGPWILFWVIVLYLEERSMVKIGQHCTDSAWIKLPEVDSPAEFDVETFPGFL